MALVSDPGGFDDTIDRSNAAHFTLLQEKFRRADHGVGCPDGSGRFGISGDPAIPMDLLPSAVVCYRMAW